ncbi:hypothetical protein AVEN_21439-1 [Araneus ventricosus]|uniref:Uncharacterized protein n=1 Tax=Araneus ventricosus TaxID=182803 RepID=A0A4Y2R962_ARAVE|nr:hypothetical protein AVEN_21439-1 [Araneus ventricosus]
MRSDCFQYASKTRRPKCLLPYKMSPPELVLVNCYVFGVSLLCTDISTTTHAYGVKQVCDYTDRLTVSSLTDLAQNFIRTYIHDKKTVYEILSIWLFKFLSYSVRMTSNIQTDRLPVDGFCPKFDRNLQIMFKDHKPNFIPVALIVFELSCSQTDRQTHRHNSKIVFFGLRAGGLKHRDQSIKTDEKTRGAGKHK